MDYSVVILPSAIQDLDNILEYYSLLSKQTQVSFKTELDKTIKILKINPYFQIRQNNLRGISIKKFPYIVLFKIDAYKKVIHIVAVFNTKQSTSKYPV